MKPLVQNPAKYFQTDLDALMWTAIITMIMISVLIISYIRKKRIKITVQIQNASQEMKESNSLAINFVKIMKN